MAIVYGDRFQSLQDELDRMLATAFGGFRPSGGVFPLINLFDQGDAYVVKAELPGVDPEKVEIQVEDDTLTLRGERSLTEPKQDVAYHRRERGAGQFRRVVRLPGRLDSGEAKAEYRDGVLTVRIPKAKETRPRRVEIQVG